MNIFEIRMVIAESGKDTVVEIVKYFREKYPNADIKKVREQAWELKNEASFYNFFKS